jgi:flagellar biogenesis protein FliO
VKAKGVAAACLVLALWARADDGIESRTLDEQYGPPAAGAVRAPSGGLLRPLGVMLVLVGLGGGLYVLARRVRSRQPFFGGRNLSVLETAYLSPKHSMALVRVRNRILVLGLGEDVRTLAVFDQPDEVLGFEGAFSRELSEALEDGAEGGNDRGPGVPLEPYRRQIDRLRGAVARWRTRLAGAPPEPREEVRS